GSILKCLAIHFFRPVTWQEPSTNWAAITGDARQNENKVKGNIMKQLLALICGATVIVAYAQAQTDTTSSTTTSSPATTSMTSTGSTVSNLGTVTDYTPGAAIAIDPGTGKPRSEEHTS